MSQATTLPAADDIAEAIDLARYPIRDLDTPGAAAVIADARRQMAETGSCVLPGFVTASATSVIAAEAASVADKAYRGPPRLSTAYLQDPDESFPERHPMRRALPSSVGAVAYDLIPPQTLIRRLYEWDGLLRFLEHTLDRGPLYRYGDPLGALNVAVMQDGEALRWHFDQTDFVVSVLLQASERGGVFEYAPRIRNAAEPHYDAVERVLDGTHDGVIALDMEPGTLALFEGRNSIHRVTEIGGAVPRLIALFGYDTKPGTMSSPRLQQTRYGRAP